LGLVNGVNMTLQSSCGTLSGQCALPGSAAAAAANNVSAITGSLVPGTDANGFNFTVLAVVLQANGSCLFANATEPSTGDVVALELCLSSLVEVDGSGAAVATVSALDANFGSQHGGSVGATGALGFNGGVLSNGAGLNVLYSYYNMYVRCWKGPMGIVGDCLDVCVYAVDKTMWRRWCCWDSRCRCRSIPSRYAVVAVAS
jgi:hypothetical protein